MKKLFTLVFALFVINIVNGQWVEQFGNYSVRYFFVSFFDANIGYAIGDGYPNYYSCMKTNDGGNQWQEQDILAATDGRGFQSIFLTGANTAIGVGDGGIIFKTTDGGTTWAQKASGTTKTLFSICFVNSNAGYAVGNNGVIIKTLDGGESWTMQTSGTSESLSSVQFVNQNIGMAVGANKTILKTTNGGNSWMVQNSGVTNEIGSFSLIDENIAYVLDIDGNLLKTTNGGTLWAIHNPNMDNYYSIFFVDANLGFACGGSGKVRKTTDGGTKWATQETGTMAPMYSIYFTDPNIGYVVGSAGHLYKTTNGGGIPGGINDLSSKSNTLNIYPNPTSNLITIETSAMSTQSQLSILNLHGQDLISRQITKPKTQLDITNLPNGVYFVRLTDEMTVQLGKFVKQ